jgi:hypothetical protein
MFARLEDPVPRAGQNEILQSFPFIPFRHIFFHSFSFHSIPATSRAGQE